MDEPLPSLVFALPPAVTLQTADAVAADLKALLLEEKAVLTLDISRVETIASAGLQLIVSLEKTLDALGGALTVAGERKDAVTRAFRDAGLERILAKVL